MVLVKDLKPMQGFDELILEITSKGEVRDFASKSGASGKVCNAAGKDSKGEEISITLWNEQCSEVEEGDKIKITEGWVSSFQGKTQVSAGKKGKIEKM